MDLTHARRRTKEATTQPVPSGTFRRWYQDPRCTRPESVRREARSLEGPITGGRWMAKPRRRQAGEGSISEYATKAGPRFLIKYSAVREDGTKRVVLKRGFKTRKDAAAALRAEIRRSKLWEWAEPSKQRLDAYLDEWVQGQRLSPLTLASYRKNIRLHIEVFSTDWSLKRGQNNCSSNDGTDSLRAQSDASKCLPAGLEQRDPAFAGGAQTADELVAGEVVRVEVAALGRRQHAGTGAVVAFVGQAGQPQHGGRGVQRAEEPGGAGGGEVVGRAGLDGGDRHRKAGGVTDDLHVATVGPVFAGVPQVMAGLRVGRAAPVGGDQRAVQRHVGPAGGLAGLEHLM